MPLIIKGARQVGKTYVLQEWGRKNFARMHYINFEKSTRFSNETFETTTMRIPCAHKINKYSHIQVLA